MLKQIVKAINAQRKLYHKMYHFRPYIHGRWRKVHMGASCIVNNCLFNTRSGHIYLGHNVKISHNVMLLTGEHDYEDPEFKVIEKGKDITIGDNVWICAGVIVIGGVKIGKNSVVCAGAVVTKDVPENVMVGGVPAKVIKEIRK